MMEGFLIHRRARRTPRTIGNLHDDRVMSAVLDWLTDLTITPCDAQIRKYLCDILSFQPKHRPNAKQIWKVLANCTDNADSSTIDFCCPFCVRLLPEDPLLKADPGVDPSQTKYASSLSLPNAKPIGKMFITRYDGDL